MRTFSEFLSESNHFNDYTRTGYKRYEHPDGSWIEANEHNTKFKHYNAKTKETKKFTDYDVLRAHVEKSHGGKLSNTH